MITGILYAHSGLRFLVLLAGLTALGYALYGIVTKRPWDRGMRISGASFAGLLHLQVLLGIILAVGGRYFPAVIGHIVLMVAAAVAAQLPLSMMKRRPIEERSYTPHLLGAAVALLLIWGGVTAIGRGLFATSTF